MKQLDTRWGPKFQRGILHPIGFWVPPGGKVVLTTHNLVDTALFPDTEAQSAIAFLNNGSFAFSRLVESDGSFEGEWWSEEPETDIGDGYEVRALSAGKTGTWTTSGAADDVWITLDVGRSWVVNRAIVGSSFCTATFELGLDGVESALDSAVITCRATVE